MRKLTRQRWIGVICEHCGRMKKFDEWIHLTEEELRGLCERFYELDPQLDVCPMCRKDHPDN